MTKRRRIKTIIMMNFLMILMETFEEEPYDEKDLRSKLTKSEERVGEQAYVLSSFDPDLIYIDNKPFPVTIDNESSLTSTFSDHGPAEEGKLFATHHFKQVPDLTLGW